MKAVYLDTSAFVKTILDEDESEALRRFLARDKPGRRISSSLIRAEALRAVRHLAPDALAAVRAGLRRIDLVGIDDRILDAAGTLEPAIVRTLDAIHLATAEAIGDDLGEIVTYDARMIEGARALGLPVLTPT